MIRRPDRRRLYRPQPKPKIPSGLSVLQMASIVAILGFLVFLAGQQIYFVNEVDTMTPALAWKAMRIGGATVAFFAVPFAIHGQTRAGRHVLLIAITYLNAYLLSPYFQEAKLLVIALFAVIEAALVWFLYRYRPNVVYFDALK